MLQPPTRLTCIEVRRRIENNTATKPLFGRALDENGDEFDIILKVRQPDVEHGHFEATSLACELICSVIARAIGFTVPDYCIVEVRGGLLDGAPTPEIRRLLADNIGLNFGSLYIEGCAPWIPPAEGGLEPDDEICADLEDVLVFDSVVFNGDRKRTKTNLLWAGYDLIPIDHSLALLAHDWTAERITASPLFPEEQIRQHCAFPSVEGHEREYLALLEIWRQNVTEADITQLRTFIPKAWERQPGDLDRIFDFLRGRSGQFDATTQHLRRIAK